MGADPGVPDRDTCASCLEDHRLVQKEIEMPHQLVAHHLGGEVIAGTGASVNAPGIPEGTNAIWVMARGGAVYVTVNGQAGPLTSPVYVADGTCRFYGYFDNIHSLGVYCDADVYAHLSYDKFPA